MCGTAERFLVAVAVQIDLCPHSRACPANFVSTVRTKLLLLLIICVHVYMICSKYFVRCVYSADGIANRYGLDGPGLNLDENEIFRKRPHRIPAFCKKGTGFLSRGLGGLAVALPTHLHLALKLKKSRVTLLLPHWAYVACYKINFTLLTIHATIYNLPL
jgi:hypothetical protein